MSNSKKQQDVTPAHNTPLIIGLTGGIGSGKSTVSQLFAEQGIQTIDTDEIARQLVQPGSPGLQAVIAEFGDKVLLDDHTLNRGLLRDIIFNDPQAKLQLEAILHPLIQSETQNKISQFKQNSQAPFILVAIPLLIEGIQQKGTRPGYIDEVWVVDTPIAQQRARASQRDGVSPAQIERIIQQQASREERLAMADRVIENDGDLSALARQVKNLLSRFE